MTAPSPARFFPSLGKTEVQGTPTFLDALQISLRENKTCGFVEAQINQNTQVVLLLAHGILAGSYLLEGNHSKPFHLTDLNKVWDGTPTPIRVVETPQIVGRMMWLALESQTSEEAESAGAQPLRVQTQKWKAENFSGAIEVRDGKRHGIFYIHEGNFLDTESFLFDGGNFEEAPAIGNMEEDAALKIIVHKPFPDSQSQQCLTLRQAVRHWSAGALGRYQELVGQKMMRMAQKDIEDIAKPWGWKISIERAALRDEHFFPHTQTAAQAYRAIYMEFGSQMEQVIGSAIANRILSETFEVLEQGERAALELHRLIPAAFSE